MLAAAKTFVQTWREMRAVESVLTSSTLLFRYSVAGDFLTRPQLELIGPSRPGELSPTMIEGLTLQETNGLNNAFRESDNELMREMSAALRAAGFDGRGLKVYHPKSQADERGIYAPDPNPLMKKMAPYMGNGVCDVVRVDVA